MNSGLRHQDRAAPGARLEGLKWVALLTMCVDHTGKTVLFGFLEPTHIVGRLAFPLFALIIAMRVARRPELSVRYLRRLLPWAIVAQPAYGWIAGGSRGNVLFTFTLGVALFTGVRWLWHGDRIDEHEGRTHRGPWGLILVAVAVGLSGHVEFGFFGVLSVPLIATVAHLGATPAALVCGPIALLANGLPPELVNLSALLATPVALLLLRWAPRVPRLPRLAFYLFYPAHLYMLYGALWLLYG